MEPNIIITRILLFLFIFANISNNVYVIPIFLDFVYFNYSKTDLSLLGLYFAVLILSNDIRILNFGLFKKIFNKGDYIKPIRISYLILALGNISLAFSNNFYIFLVIRLVSALFNSLDVFLNPLLKLLLKTEEKEDYIRIISLLSSISYVLGFTIGLFNFSNINTNISFGNKYAISFGIEGVICIMAFISTFIIFSCLEISYEKSAIEMKKVKKIIKNEQWQNSSNPESDRNNNIEIKFTLSSHSAGKKNSLVLFDNDNSNTEKNKNPNDVSVCNLDTITENENIRKNIDNILDQDEYIEDFSVRIEKNLKKASSPNKDDKDDNKSGINASVLATNENFEKADNLLTATNNSILKSNIDSSGFPKKVEDILEIDYNQLGDEDIEKKENNDSNKLDLGNNGNGNHNHNHINNKDKDDQSNIQTFTNNLEVKDKPKDKGTKGAKPNKGYKGSKGNTNKGNNEATEVDSPDFLNSESKSINSKSILISTFYTLVKSLDNTFFLLFMLYLYTEIDKASDILFRLIGIITAINVLGSIIFFFVVKKLVSIPSENVIEINKKAMKIFLVLSLCFVVAFYLVISRLLGLDDDKTLIILIFNYGFIFIISKITLEFYKRLKENMQNTSVIKKVKSFETYLSRSIILILSLVSCAIFSKYFIASKSDIALGVLGGMNILMLIFSYILVSFIKD